MPRPACPPLPIDAELTALADSYRAAKERAARSARRAGEIARAGHYDADAAPPDDDANAREERRAALALADALLAWIDKHA